MVPSANDGRELPRDRHAAHCGDHRRDPDRQWHERRRQRAEGDDQDRGREREGERLCLQQVRGERLLAWLAWLDAEFASATTQWPEIASAPAGRLTEASRGGRSPPIPDLASAVGGDDGEVAPLRRLCQRRMR